MSTEFPSEFGCYSNHIIFVDESGDHGFSSIDSSYPVFVLAFCIFETDSYIFNAVTALESFKFQYFGHDQAILHEREIRKYEGDFKPLMDRTLREEFMESLTNVIEVSEFTILSITIDKKKYLQEHPEADNGYEIALRTALPWIYQLLRSANDVDCTTHIVFESRGKKEDSQLELDFLRICSLDNPHRVNYPFKFRQASKLCNSSGLQLADLVARPIGRNYIAPDQPNRAYASLHAKIATNESGKVSGNIVIPNPT